MPNANKMLVIFHLIVRFVMILIIGSVRINLSHSLQLQKSLFAKTAHYLSEISRKLS